MNKKELDISPQRCNNHVRQYLHLTTTEAYDSLVDELCEYGRENLAFMQVIMQSPYVTFTE